MASRGNSQPRGCACGCDEVTKGGEFRPGHDAKLRGQFLKRISDGEEKAIEEFITERPNLVFPYGYTEASLRARLGSGK